MELEKMIELLEKVCNVEYDINDFNSVEDLLYYYYIDSGMFTQDELDLITHVNDWNVETFNDALFSRYGYRDLEQMLEEV